MADLARRLNAIYTTEVPFGHNGALLAVLEEANDPAVGGPSALDVWLGLRSVQQLASAPRQVFRYDDLGALESSLRREHLPAGLVGDELHDNGSWLVRRWLKAA